MYRLVSAGRPVHRPRGDPSAPVDGQLDIFVSSKMGGSDERNEALRAKLKAIFPLQAQQIDRVKVDGRMPAAMSCHCLSGLAGLGHPATGGRQLWNRRPLCRVPIARAVPQGARHAPAAAAARHAGLAARRGRPRAGGAEKHQPPALLGCMLFCPLPCSLGKGLWRAQNRRALAPCRTYRC